MAKDKKYELSTEVLGVNGLDPFVRHTNSARAAMFATHIGQAPVPKDAEQRRIFTGMEQRYGEYAYTVHFPENCRVLKLIPKYRRGIGDHGIRENPTTYAIYEADDDQHTIGVLEIPGHKSMHKDFGFELHKRRDVWERIREKSWVSKDEIIASSNSLKSDGTYGQGINANMCTLSLPSTIEDGFLVSESFLNRMDAKCYHTHACDFGKKYYPLNLYGDNTYYKPFPDIGERVRDDGLLFALREVDQDSDSMWDMTPKALREVDYAGKDKLIYGEPNAIVKDITAYFDDNIQTPKTPIGMEEQANKYYQGMCDFYRSVIAEYRRLFGRRGKDNLHISYEFDQLIFEALVFLPQAEVKDIFFRNNDLHKSKLRRKHRLDTLDEWRVEVTYEFDDKPNIGEKFTDMAGGKGVVCKIMKDEDMPIDANGNRAEIVIYGPSQIKRLKIGGFYEQFFNATSRDLIQSFRKTLGLDPHSVPEKNHLIQVLRARLDKVNEFFERLTRLYEILSPKQYALYKDANEDEKIDHLLYVITEGVYLYLPPDNPVDYIDAVGKIKDSDLCPLYQPIQYRDQVGNWVTTKTPVLIGEVYMIMLEKRAREWSGVSSASLHFLGIPTKLNNTDKNSTYGKEQPVRALGEAEVRGWDAATGTELVADILDQSNNPDSHRSVVDSIIRSDQPTNIPRSVDRRKIPYGGSRPLQLVKNITNAMGCEFYIADEEGNEIDMG